MSTTLAPPSQPIGTQLNQVQPSAFALSTGQALLAIMLSVYLQSLSYEEQKALLQTQNTATQGLAKSTQAALNAQASATMDGALGQIIGGVVGTAAEVGAVYATTADSEVNDLTSQVKAAESWQAELNKGPAAGSVNAAVRPVDANAVVLDDRFAAEHIANLKKANPNLLASDKENQGAAQSLKILQAEVTPQGTAAIEEMKTSMTNKIASLQKKLETAHTRVQSQAQRMGQMGQSMAQMTQGLGQTAASTEQTAQAYTEAAKVQLQFVQQAMAQLIQVLGSNVSNLGGLVSSGVSALLAGIAQGNTPV